MTVTHHQTLASEIRTIANGCDLGSFNSEFFLKASFISELAFFVQQKELEAYNRGLAKGRNYPTPAMSGK